MQTNYRGIFVQIREGTGANSQGVFSRPMGDRKGVLDVTIYILHFNISVQTYVRHLFKALEEIHNGFNHTYRKRVLLVQKNANEQTVDSRVGHFCKLHNGCS